MKDFLHSGTVGKIELNEQKRMRNEVQKRWEELGFLTGLSGVVKENVAQLYETQAGYLLREATDSSNSGSFETVVFPIIRRVFSRLLANDIVSVQALNLPIGRLFFMLPKTSERKWEMQVDGQITDGDTGSHYGLMGYERENAYYDPTLGANTGSRSHQYQNRYYHADASVNITAPDGTALPEEIPGITPLPAPTFDGTGTGTRNLPVVTQYMKKSLYDLFYNDFLYDNSRGKITLRVGTAQPITLAPDGSIVPWTGALSTYPQNGYDNAVRNVIVEVSGFSSWNAGKLTGADGNEMDTEAFLASLKVMATAAIGDPAGDFTSFAQFESIPFRVVTQRYGKGIIEYGNPCDAQGKIYLELDLSKPTKNQGQTMDGYIGVDPTALTNINLFQIAWAQYDSLELETEIAEVTFEMTSVTVDVTSRKMRTTWSPEMAQDVSAFHNIDAEAELTSLLSAHIAAEIDREILRDLRKGAPWQLRWDYNGWRRRTGFSTNYTQKDWNQTLITAVNQISAQIQKATLQGGANFIVVSSHISAVLNDLEYFHVSDASAESDQYNMGIERIGSLQGRYQVYVDPYAPDWSMIIGHKGKSLLDTGYIYAPYIPMQLTPTIVNPDNFAPVKGIMTRYAKKMVNNKFYGHIRVDGLTVWSPYELR